MTLDHDAVARAMSETGVPGWQVAIVREGATPTVLAGGWADPLRTIAMNDRHLLQIGSIGKMVTAMQAVRLVLRDAMGLDDPITTLVPDLPDTLRREDITLRRLLHHASGVPRGADIVPREWSQLDTAIVAFDDGPRPPFHYSNLGYVLVGLAIEAVDGTSLAEGIARDIFAPLGMTEALARIRDEDRDRYAPGHSPWYGDRPWMPGAPLTAAPWVPTAGGDGPIAANATDMARFAAALLQPDGRAVTAEILAELRSVHWRSPQGFGYGLGTMSEGEGDAPWGHSGGMLGYRSQLTVYPADGTAIVVLANGESPLLRRAVARIARTCGVQDTFDFGRAPVGRFIARSRSAAVPQVIDVDDRGELRAGDERAALVPLGPDVWATTHSAFARHVFEWVQGTWWWAGTAYDTASDEDSGAVMSGAETPGAEIPGAETPDRSAPGRLVPDARDAGAPYCGRFRSYSPWISTVTVFLRDGEPWCSLMHGPAVRLVPVGPRTWRFDRPGPERLVFAPPRNGKSQTLSFSGCEYARDDPQP